MMTFRKAATFSLLLFPVVLLTIKPLAIILFVLIALMGVYVAVKKKMNPFLVSEIKMFSWLSVGYFMVMFLSVLVSNEPTSAWAHLSRVSYFLFAPFVALTITQINVSTETLLKSFKTGSVMAGMIALSGFMMANGGGRFSGMYNPNTFGDLSVLMLFFSIINISAEGKRDFWFSAAAAVCAVTAIVMSASRGSLAALALLLVLYVFLMLKSHRQKNLRIMIALLLFALGGNLYLSHTRILSVKKEIRSSNSSFGQRSDMYRGGWRAFKDSPLIGYGYYNCGSVTARYVNQDALTQEHYAGRWHLHDESLTNLVNAGILGFISLWALFLFPLFLFLKNYKNSVSARAGVMFIAGYILLGLSHTLFGYEYETAFFVIMLAFLLYRTIGKKSHAK